MNDKTKKKYTVKCQVCVRKWWHTNSDFAKQHINKNPSHLEYRAIVKIISPAVSDNQPTLIVDNVQ